MVKIGKRLILPLNGSVVPKQDLRRSLSPAGLLTRQENMLQ